MSASRRDERWRNLYRVINETFKEFEVGMAALRKRVVMNLKGKLGDAEVQTKRRWVRRSE